MVWQGTNDNGFTTNGPHRSIKRRWQMFRKHALMQEAICLVLTYPRQKGLRDSMLVVQNLN